MTGTFIIEGQYDDDLNAWYGAGWTRTQPVLVINQRGVTPNLSRGGGQIDKGAGLFHQWPVEADNTDAAR